MVAAPALAAQQRTETEPNDEFSTANVLHVGDTISAQFPIHADRDFFAFDLAAGARIQFTFIGNQGCRSVSIYDPSRTALKGKNCYTEHADTLNATASVAGRYYVRINDDDDAGEAFRPYSYQFRVSLYTAPPAGLGNPLTLLTDDVNENEVLAMVAAPNGDMLVLVQSIATGYAVDRVFRVTPEGHVTTFASGMNATGQIAIDAFGDLLVPSGDQGGVVWRYDLKTGTRTIFTGPPSAPDPWYGVTIGADGDVWLSSTPGGSEGATFYRFDAFGTFKSQVPVNVRASSLTTAQNGELFFRALNSGDVYRLANNTTSVRV
ncbi:MAG TPA: hypothetical protein VN513_07800, partial [Gemmatimonadales bacterium]|nr:hypothetical protein [Gemmatimonadales bacterium]